MQQREEDALVARYIERLTELESQQGAGKLGHDDLTAIAREIGADDALLEKAKATADARFGETVRHIEAGELDAAELRLRVARDLAPFDPRGPALAQRIATARRRRRTPMLVGFFAAFGLTLGIFFASRHTPETPTPPSEPPPASRVVMPTPSAPRAAPQPTAKPAPRLTPTAPSRNRSHHAVPVTLEVESKALAASGGKIVMRQPAVEHRVYTHKGGKGFLHAALELGYLGGEGSGTVTRLAGRIELLNEAGEPLASHPFEAVRRSDSPMRAGDYRSVAATARAPTAPIASSARVVVELVTVGDPTPAESAERPSLPLQWRVQRPEGLTLEIRERAFTVRPSGKKHFHQLELEVQPRGGSLGLLRIEVRFFDAGGELIEVQTPYVTTSSQPALLDGTQRQVRRVALLEKAAVRYEIAVLQLQ